MRDIEIGLLDPASAGDGRLLTDLARLVNEVYAVGEAGLWAADVPRTSVAELGWLVASGEVAVARRGGEPVGTVRVHDHGPDVGEFGMLAAAFAHRGVGVGRSLIEFAEGLGRARGWWAMRLELLVPRTGTHPSKEVLKSWYGRLGYVVIGSAPAEASHPELAPLLAVPGDFLVFEKPLGGGRAG